MRGVAAAVVAATLAAAGIAEARPAYFEAFKTLYGIGDGDNLNACGVCHFRWTGTGARNPFGTSVEQQLYVGKSITQSLMDVEGLDSDGDTFSNGDEIMTYMTLPGYSCDTFFLAVSPPLGYDTYITPMVATCLDPLDIRVSPSSASIIETIGQMEIYDVTIFNNGSDDPVEVSNLELLPTAPAALTVIAPDTPFSIPVGESQVVQLVFAPTSTVFANTHLRIESNDPDEAIIDLPVNVLSVPDPTAPAAQRSVCFRALSKATSKFAKTHLKEWTACYQDELSGKACNTGARDLKIGGAFAKFQGEIGGAKDKFCAGTGITRAGLGFPAGCPGECSDVVVSGLADIPTCLACIEERVMEGMLREGAGTAPPDLPPNIVGGKDSFSCQRRILKDLQKAILKMYRVLTDCENGLVAADVEGGTCDTDIAEGLATLRAKLDATVAKCKDTTDLLGCRFEGMSPDPECLGIAAENLANELTDATFGLFELP